MPCIFFKTMVHSKKSALVEIPIMVIWINHGNHGMAKTYINMAGEEDCSSYADDAVVALLNNIS